MRLFCCFLILQNCFSSLFFVFVVLTVVGVTIFVFCKCPPEGSSESFSKFREELRRTREVKTKAVHRATASSVQMMSCELSFFLLLLRVR